MISPTLRSLVAPACAAAILVTASAASAADVAQWTFGDGQVAGAPVMPGANIASGAAITAGANAPVLVSIAGGAQGMITLAPGAAITLTQATIEGHNVLELTVVSGAAQVDLTNKGQYEQMLVQSGPMQVAVTGTMFVIEHAKSDHAYCALVRGKIKARQTALNNATSAWIDVNSHQGVGTSENGLGSVDNLAVRPQMISSNGQPLGLREQAANTATPSTASASWHADAAYGAALLAAVHSGPAIVATIVHFNVSDAAEGEAAISGSHPGDADRIVAAVAENSGADLTAFIHEIAIDDSAHCGERLTAGIVAAPGQAANLTGAAVSGNPDQAVDLTVAGVVTDPKDAQAIVNAACTSAPGQTATITSAAQTLDPSVTTPASAGTKPVVASNTSGHGTAPASAPANSGFTLPAPSAPINEPIANPEPVSDATGSIGGLANLVPLVQEVGPLAPASGIPIGSSVGTTIASGNVSNFTAPATVPAVSGE